VNAGQRSSLIFSIAMLAAGLSPACEARVMDAGDWSPEGGEANAGPYVEAENGQLSGGITIGDDARASGERYIVPPAAVASEDEPGQARARYVLRASSAGDYVIWGRIRSPSIAANRFWVQVDGGSWFKWRISVGDIWYWDDFHDDVDYGTPLSFPFAQGDHELVIANCVDGVALDRLYFTAAGDEPPGNDTECNPPHSIQIGGVCVPSCGSLSGSACGEAACTGRPLLSAYDCAICCQPEP
jgi:hypothetical protein